jgi:hypothetical protein
MQFRDISKYPDDIVDPAPSEVRPVPFEVRPKRRRRTETPADLIERALALLDGGKGWCKGSIARDEDGNPLRSATLRSAVTWCSIGAVQKLALSVVIRQQAERHLNEAASKIMKHEYVTAVHLNDGHATTFALVKHMFELARQFALSR